MTRNYLTRAFDTLNGHVIFVVIVFVLYFVCLFFIVAHTLVLPLPKIVCLSSR